jgi:hypothetical protein
VEQAVPLIFTRDTLDPPMKIWARVLAGGIAAFCLGLLATGMMLRPNGEAGISTHTQLGLPPCQFEERMKIPCPSCGYTTSVSYFAHGNVLASIYVQPMGFVIGLFFAVTVWVGGYIAATGRPVHRLLARLPGRSWILWILAIALGGWGWKIWIHLTNRDHWPL